MDFHAIIVAAGQGNRMGGLKQYMLLLNKPVILWSLMAFKEAGAKSIRLVVSDFELALSHIPKPWQEHIKLIKGGDSRKNLLKTPSLISSRMKPILIVLF